MSNDISVEEFFMIMSSSCPGHDDRVGDPTEAFLSDFFGVWRRHYSPERIWRVTGREPNDPRPILQNNATLDKMLKETGLLGFYGSLRIEVEDTHCVKCYRSEEGVKSLYDRSRLVKKLSLDWVDPERLELGYAPQAFMVSFKTVESEAVFDSEAWASDVFNGSDYLFDSEAWANAWMEDQLIVKSGVMIDEDHGPYPFYLQTWGDWDQYITGVMRYGA